MAIWYALRWAYPPIEDEPPTPAERAVRGAVTVAAGLAGIILLYLIANLLIRVGDWIADNAGWLDFIGAWLASNGDILEAVIIVLTALDAEYILLRLSVPGVIERASAHAIYLSWERFRMFRRN